MKVILRRESAQKTTSLKHPWIFRTAIKACEGAVENGARAEIFDDEGGRIGTGFYSGSSKIACRVYAWGGEEPPADWAVRRLGEALALRRTQRIDSDACRLVNAEGDFIPGLVVDAYGGTVVLRPSVRGAELLVPELVAALGKLLPGSAVYLKRDEKAARVEGLRLPTGYLAGGGDDTAVPIREHGLSFLVDLREGQKTGFYLDQRENRRFVGELAEGRSVLNLFSYTGAFALAALRGGARLVDSVDISQKALERAERNYALNSFPAAHEVRWIREDGFDFLERAGAYDLIVLDPPPFARSKGEVPGALRGHRRLQTAALQRLSAGGLLAAFSCSGAVDAVAFRRVLFEAALAAGRPVRVIRELHAAGDHPWSVAHREGEYLKGFLAYVS
jgi:23S rRNA (cytosine1962-C5)-methyltransferase